MKKTYYVYKGAAMRQSICTFLMKLVSMNINFEYEPIGTRVFVMGSIADIESVDNIIKRFELDIHDKPEEQ